MFATASAATDLIIGAQQSMASRSARQREEAIMWAAL